MTYQDILGLWQLWQSWLWLPLLLRVWFIIVVLVHRRFSISPVVEFFLHIWIPYTRLPSCVFCHIFLYSSGFSTSQTFSEKLYFIIFFHWFHWWFCFCFSWARQKLSFFNRLPVETHIPCSNSCLCWFSLVFSLVCSSSIRHQNLNLKTFYPLGKILRSSLMSYQEAGISSSWNLWGKILFSKDTSECSIWMKMLSFWRQLGWIVSFSFSW